MNQEQYSLIKLVVPAWNTWRAEHPDAQVDLSRADLRGAYLSRADLRGAYLRGANLTEADLRGADLRGADLYGTKGVWVITPIGSRGDILVAALWDDGLHYFTGCFSGTEVEFLAAVEKTHGDNRHGREYRAAVEMMRALAQMEEGER